MALARPRAGGNRSCEMCLPAATRNARIKVVTHGSRTGVQHRVATLCDRRKSDAWVSLSPPARG